MRQFIFALAAAVMGAGMAANAALPITSGLVCWYDADVGVTTDDTGAILTWDDQSGLEHQGTVGGGSTILAEDQLNSRPAAQFRGSYLNLAGSLFVKEQYLVMRSPTATWSGGGGFLCRAEGRGSSYDMRNGDVTFWPDQAPDAVSKNGTSIPAESLDNSQYVLQPLTSYMILKIVVNDNNTSEASYQIGRADTGTVDFDVVEIIGYDRMLSAEEEASTGSYLADRYDLITAYPALTPQAKILGFGLPGMPAVIDQSAKTIAWTVPGGTNRSSLAPEFTLSEGATCDHLSGTTYNFTSPVNYIVTPSVGAPKTYTVTVTVDPKLSVLPVTSGLVCWYDASAGVTTNESGEIQTWNDLSGQAHHGVRIIDAPPGPPTLVPDLINSRPAAQFRGGYLSLDNPLFAKEQYVVVRSPSDTWTGSGATLGRRTWRSYYLQGGTTRFWQDVWPLAVRKGGILIPQDPVVDGVGYDLAPITDFMLLRITVQDDPPATHEIGMTSGDSLHFDVAEIIGYDSPLSVDDENLLGSYLSSKYGVPFEPVTAISSAADILTFGLPDRPAAIDQSEASIAWTVPDTWDVANLAPEYTVSPLATEDLFYPSGSFRDFTFPVTYTITAEDGTLKGYTVTVTVEAEGTRFIRGNANADATLNITDGIYILNYLFLGGPPPPCLEAANANGDTTLNITDGIYVLNFLFLGGPAPPAPYPDCAAVTPAPDCASFPACAG